MKLIELNKSFYDFPESWNELTQKQLLQVMSVLYVKKYKPEEILLKLLQVMTGMTNYQFFRCKVEELEEFFYLLVFLLNDEIDLTKNLMPFYHDKDQDLKFYGPEAEAVNMIMKEYAFSESLFLRWWNDKEDTRALDELIAVLYRPAKPDYDFKRNPDGDCREAFNPNLLTFYTDNYTYFWPMEVKLAIAYWYGSCRNKIVKDNPEIFEGGSGDPALHGIVSLMMNVAKDGVLGDFTSVEDKQVSLVLIQLRELIAESKRLEKQYKK